MNIKAQIVGQVFIFILAAGLAVLIIAYGYSAITGFTERTKEIAFINFKTDLQTEIRTIASDFGSVKRLDLTMPGNFRKLCLIDLYKNPNNYCLCSSSPNCIGNSLDNNPLICDSWRNPSFPRPDNAFLVPITPIKLSTIEIEEGYICLEPIGNKISLKLEGFGNRTKVSKWPVQT